MYGRYMGGLRLFAYEKRRGSNKAQEKLVWEKFGDQKNLWHERTEFYRPSSTVEVRKNFCCVTYNKKQTNLTSFNVFLHTV